MKTLDVTIASVLGRLGSDFESVMAVLKMISY